MSNQVIPGTPLAAPTALDVKEHIRQAGFLLKKQGHFLIFKASTTKLVNGWSNHLSPSTYAEEFVHAIRETSIDWHRVGVNRYIPAKQDIYIVRVTAMPTLLAKWFEAAGQEFIYDGSDSAEALRVASEVIHEMAGRINASQ